MLLIEPRDRFVFLPLLYELLSGELRRWEVAPRYADLLAGSGVVWRQDRVETILPAERRLLTRSGQSIGYGQLVIASGARPETYGIPGVDDHALGFHNLEDVTRLQQLVQQLRQHRRPLQRLVVVGGGATGVELICKLADLLEGSTILELVDQGPDLLPASRAFNREQARLALQSRDIRLRTGTRVEAVGANHLRLRRMEAGAAAAAAPSLEELTVDGVIWTAGTVATVPALEPPLGLDGRGRLVCTPQLAVEGIDQVFALGDAAACPWEEGLAPATAQVAYQQAAHLVTALPLARRGGSPAAFHWNDLGEMLGLGVGQATLTGLGVTLAGPAAFTLRRAAYLMRQPGLGQQLRLAAGWLAGRG